MSKVVDSYVSEMRFDNSQFESNVKTSMSTLEKLKQSLNLKGASKGLENISSTAKRFDMSGMGSAVESVRVKFSALEVMAVTALANITNSAVNAGKRIVSALTIEPITTGFQEYETQINAVQTILANTSSKGTSLQQVNDALDELNTYADKTIYNFTEMTRNIGTFTAAGVDLKTSVSAIQGIANLAAISGSTSMQASTAMYQLSQALAAGKVQLMDWNSVVNAGMGGEVFQNALKRTATQMGYNVDALIEKYGSFRESLTEGSWLTTEVLTETLTQLSGAYTEADLIAQGYTEKQAKEIVELANTAVDAATKVKTFTQLWDTLKEAAQSGWTQSWEIIVGDFEEAKSLLTEISDTVSGMLNTSAEARNKVLSEGLSSG
ncbi:MAG: tape measure protein [Eubacteriales bacterium]|nr:tape measure protein [Eubacteriales bacterium]